MQAEKDAKIPFGQYLLIKYRGEFVTLFILPISVMYSLFLKIRNYLVFKMNSAPLKHDEKVKKVQDQILQWKAEGSKEKLTTSRSGWFTMSELVPAYKKERRQIELNLRDVLEVDTKRKVVRVEPLVNMGQITAALNPLGWTLAVIPELDDLTVGGLINGFGVESSSHKYGLFQYTIESLEIINAEGELIRCSKTENTELFYTLPWSHGTLGLLVAAELKIIPAAKYVKVEYRAVKGLKNIVDEFENASRDFKNDFVELLQYTRDTAVLMCGTFANEKQSDGEINKIGSFYKPWFYKHVEQFLETKKHIEYIPLRDYYHRHTRSFFWEMELIIPFGNKPWFRWLLGWAVPPHISLLKYIQADATKEMREKNHVVQDMLVPITHLEKSLDYFDTEFNVYPLWICPMAVYNNEKNIGFIHSYKKADGSLEEMFVDIGAYGTPKKRPFDAREALPALEQFVIEHGGYQAMYAKTYLTKEDFRKMFDHSYYDEYRKNNPNTIKAFGEVFDKLGGKARISPSEYRKLKKQSS